MPLDSVSLCWFKALVILFVFWYKVFGLVCLMFRLYVTLIWLYRLASFELWLTGCEAGWFWLQLMQVSVGLRLDTSLGLWCFRLML